VLHNNTTARSKSNKAQKQTTAMPRTTPKKASAKTSPTATSTTTSSNKKADSQKAPESIKSTKKSVSSSTIHHTVADSLDIIFPLSLGKSTMDCTVLVQIDPDDSKNLDFEGTTGAIGRFQVNKKGLVLDLKGSQYHGHLVPGPTAMLATLCYDEQHQQQLRLEAITDEFCPLYKTQDTMAKLDALILKGELDESYRLQEEDVNISAKKQEALADQQAKKQQKKKTGTTSTTKVSKKRPASSKTTNTTNKKPKTSVGKSNKKK
jgi:sRNA-binding protein